MTMTSMAKDKKRSDGVEKKKPTQLRLHPLLRRQLEKLAERNASTMTTEIVTAIRKYLEANGLWPPPQD